MSVWSCKCPEIWPRGKGHDQGVPIREGCLNLVIEALDVEWGSFRTFHLFGQEEIAQAGRDPWGHLFPFPEGVIDAHSGSTCAIPRAKTRPPCPTPDAGPAGQPIARFAET